MAGGLIGFGLVGPGGLLIGNGIDGGPGQDGGPGGLLLGTGGKGGDGAPGRVGGNGGAGGIFFGDGGAGGQGGQGAVGLDGVNPTPNVTLPPADKSDDGPTFGLRQQARAVPATMAPQVNPAAPVAREYALGPICATSPAATAAQAAWAPQAVRDARAVPPKPTSELPFERARTQLLVGQLQQRDRQKNSAAATLGEALQAFATMGTLLSAERARVELNRVTVGPRQTAQLTASEQQVAELAATGMTNRDVAAALFISPKTVEGNLSRVYHKLGIRSRAELGRRIGRSAESPRLSRAPAGDSSC